MPEIDEESLAATTGNASGDGWDVVAEDATDQMIDRLAGLYSIAMSDDSLDDPDMDPEDWEPPSLP